MKKIKRDDEVIVITGKDKGRIGKVLRIINSRSRAVVEGINLVKKHVKPNPQKNSQGGILEKEMPIHLSNLAHYNAATKKADKVGFKSIKDGEKKVRYFKSNNEFVDI